MFQWYSFCSNAVYITYFVCICVYQPKIRSYFNFTLLIWQILLSGRVQSQRAATKILTLCFTLCWRINKSRITTVRTQLYNNKKLTSYMFRPSRAHLQVDIWNMFKISVFIDTIMNEKLRGLSEAHCYENTG